jgi:hypothetical protein
MKPCGIVCFYGISSVKENDECISKWIVFHHHLNRKLTSEVATDACSGWEPAKLARYVTVKAIGSCCRRANVNTGPPRIFSRILPILRG